MAAMSRGRTALALLVAALAPLPLLGAPPAVEAGGGSAALVPMRVIAAETGSATIELSWSRSRRDGPGSGRGNHDGLWVFGKAHGADGRWRHVPLGGAEAGPGYAAQRSGDGLGALVFWSSPGEGDARARLTLHWSVAGEWRVVRLFAWPVVYVPRGAFDAGDGSPTTPGRFHDGGDPARPFRVTGDPIDLAPRTGALWADGRAWPLPSGMLGRSPWDGWTGRLPQAFPTGY